MDLTQELEKQVKIKIGLNNKLLGTFNYKIKLKALSLKYILLIYVWKYFWVNF